MRNILFLTLLLCIPSFAYAQKDEVPVPSPSPSSSFAVLDTRLVLETSAAGKSISSQLNARRDALQKEAVAFEKKVKDTESSLTSERKTLKPEEFEKKKKGFEQEFIKTRESILKKGNDLEQVRRKALSDLQNKIAKVTADIADERKIQLIVDREAVVIVQQDLDITKEVLERLNKTVQSIPLSSDQPKK